MKVRSTTRKPILNDLLALALACMVALLFTQNNVQRCETPQVKPLTNCPAMTFKKASPDKSQSDATVGDWIENIAVLNSANPVFQIRDDFRFVIEQTVSQHISESRTVHNRFANTNKITSHNIFSIIILHRQLVI